MLRGLADRSGLPADFVRLWIGQSLSMFGDRITRGALPLTAVVTLNASAGELSLLVVAMAAPVLLVGLVAGVFVDRMRRKPLLIGADIARAVLIASIPAAALMGLLGMGQLYFVAALLAVLTLFAEVAGHAFIPTLVPREQLLKANSRVATTDSVAEIAGPALAGGLVQLVTAPFAMLVDVVTFLWSILWLGQIRHQEQEPQANEEPVTVWQDIRLGLKIVLGQPVLRLLAGRAAMLSFFGSFYWVLYDLYGIKVLGLNPAIMGVLIAAGGLGALPGTLVAERVVRRFGLGHTLVGAALISGVVALLTPLAPVGIIGAGFLFAAQFIGDGLNQIYNINELTLRQTIVPEHQLGRAGGTMRFMQGALYPVGALAAGFVGDLFGARVALGIASLGFLLAVVWLLSPHITGLRDHNVAPAERPA